METADIGKHCLPLNKPDFPSWRHTYCACAKLAWRGYVESWTVADQTLL